MRIRKVTNAGKFSAAFIFGQKTFQVTSKTDEIRKSKRYNQSDPNALYAA